MTPLRTVEPWERAAAGLEDDDALRPALGVLTGLSIGIPIDICLLVWVLL